MTRTLEAEVFAHEGLRDGQVGLVNPACHVEKNSVASADVCGWSGGPQGRRVGRVVALLEDELSAE